MKNELSQEETLDLQQIRGIGPGLARRLGAAGLGDVARLAAATPEEVAAALRGLPVVSPERIGEWIAVAARLAPPPERATPDDNGQHYATFGLELLLDRDNEVRRTRINHVQSGRRASWAGWEAARVSDFVVEVAGIGRAAAIAGVATESVPDVPPETSRLHDLEIFPVGAAGAGRILHRDRPFDVRFGVTLSDSAELEPAVPLTATLYVRSLDGGERQPLGQSAVPAFPGPERAMAIAVPDAALSPGLYRLEVDLAAEGRPHRRPAAHGGRVVVVY